MAIDPSKFNMGLSRLLRYSYGGVLLIIMMLLFDKDWAKEMISSTGTSLIVFVVVVVGAGLYVLYRSIIIPLHHWLLVIFQKCYDWKNGVQKKDSVNPVIYLGSLSVGPLWKCMIAYSYLRRAGLFKDKDEVNIRHAETGLLVMTSVGLLAGSLYDKFSVKPTGHFTWMLVMAIIFFVSSFPPSWVQHSLECTEMKKEGNEVGAKLREIGILRPET